MAHSQSQFDRKEPTPSQFQLTDKLAQAIHALHAKSRQCLFDLCWYAYGLRKQHLETGHAGSGNKRGEVYSKHFRRWYDSQHLDDVYGTLPNFTKYALAGRLLTYVRWHMDAGYIDRLPGTLTGLYELSQMIGVRGERVTPEGKEELRQLFTKTRRDGKGTSSYVIHPHIEAQEISKLTNRTKGNATTPMSAETHSRPNGKLLCSIYVTADLMAFTKSTHTKKRGTLELKTVQALHSEIERLVKPRQAKREVWIDSKLDELVAQYADKTDFGKHLQ